MLWVVRLLLAQSCSDDGKQLPLATFAHTSNEYFVEKATRRERWSGPQVQQPAVITEDGALRVVALDATKFLTYESDNGWNNQLLNVLCAIDMARLLNRTLIIPPFRWQRRRGQASVSVGRLLDLRSLAPLLPLLVEDEHGSVQAALAEAGALVKTIAGEGQPHRRSGKPRWNRQRWVDDFVKDDAQVLKVTCCLFWTWSIPSEELRRLHQSLRYSFALEAGARAAAESLGPGFAALHVRRGDKLHVDRAYTRMFGSMDQNYFMRLMELEGFERGASVYVATDEPSRDWFAPIREVYNLSFVENLDQKPLLDVLAAFPQPLWADVLAILEQIICIQAPNGFVGTLPSTLSGHIVNARVVKSARNDATMFTKLHELCCDPLTQADLQRGGWRDKTGVLLPGTLPCQLPEPWC
ncbi:hypothetical protein AB1Y20_000987 [Prymnesium parvum]|uniref:Peptide-O-fucosyltransferase n=1 Tax=Prymnesium parvum TaxID=97485 RepID=A0AB34KC90_PRYPA